MNIYTAEEKHREALRELAMRKRVYPCQIASGQMGKRDAERLIAIMQEISDDYHQLACKERLL